MICSLVTSQRIHYVQRFNFYIETKTAIALKNASNVMLNTLVMKFEIAQQHTQTPLKTERTKTYEMNGLASSPKTK